LANLAKPGYFSLSVVISAQLDVEKALDEQLFSKHSALTGPATPASRGWPIRGGGAQGVRVS
jgi:hypothetical protein